MSGEHEQVTDENAPPLSEPLYPDELPKLEHELGTQDEAAETSMLDDNSSEHAQGVEVSEYRQVNVDKLIKMLFGMLGRVLGFGLAKVFGETMLLDDADADEIAEIWNEYAKHEAPNLQQSLAKYPAAAATLQTVNVFARKLDVSGMLDDSSSEHAEGGELVHEDEHAQG